MAVNSSRSQRGDLHEGATDGKYRKARPDTSVALLAGDNQTMADRATLHPWMNYDYITDEVPLDQRRVPGT